MNKKWDEEILVVDREKLFGDGFQGVETNEDYVKRLIDRITNHVEVKRRGNVDDEAPASRNMERNPDYKQLIPYVVLRRGANQIFTYKRLGAGGETRLNGNISFGVGGHMNKLGGSTFGVELVHNMYRELNEEVIMDGVLAAPEAQILGIINDDSNAVGEVHLGILIEVYLPDDANVYVRETDKLEGFWATLDDLKNTEYNDHLENWSKMSIGVLKELAYHG